MSTLSIATDGYLSYDYKTLSIATSGYLDILIKKEIDKIAKSIGDSVVKNKRIRDTKSTKENFNNQKYRILRMEDDEVLNILKMFLHVTK